MRRRKMRTKWYKFGTVALLAASVAAGVYFYSKWRGVTAENDELDASRQRLRAEIDTLQKEWERKNEYYNRLVSDGEFAERVIREKLGYAYPDDIVFRFKDTAASDIDDSFEKRESVERRDEEKSFFDSVLAFFGISHKPDTAATETAAKSSKIVPEYRIDMTNASIVAEQTKRLQALKNAPSVSEDDTAAAPPESVKLLSAASDSATMTAVSMKPIKVKLGGGNASVRAVAAVRAKPVRFVAR